MISKKLIIFDLDDTIYPEYMYNLSCYKEAACVFYKDYEVDIYENIKKNFLDRKFKNLFSLAIENTGLDVDEGYIFNKLVKTYRNHRPSLSTYTSFEEVIKKLKNKYYLAVITDGNKSIQRGKIKSLKIEKYFDFILCSDELGAGICKPMALPYDVVVNHFNVNYNDCIYIGDNVKKDFIYPKKAGMHSIHFENTLENDILIYKDLTGVEADYKCYTYNEVLDVIQKIFTVGDKL